MFKFIVFVAIVGYASAGTIGVYSAPPTPTATTTAAAPVVPAPSKLSASQIGLNAAAEAALKAAAQAALQNYAAPSGGSDAQLALNNAAQIALNNAAREAIHNAFANIAGATVTVPAAAGPSVAAAVAEAPIADDVDGADVTVLGDAVDESDFEDFAEEEQPINNVLAPTTLSAAPEVKTPAAAPVPADVVVEFHAPPTPVVVGSRPVLLSSPKNSLASSLGTQTTGNSGPAVSTSGETSASGNGGPSALNNGGDNVQGNGGPSVVDNEGPVALTNNIPTATGNSAPVFVNIAAPGPIGPSVTYAAPATQAAGPVDSKTFVTSPDGQVIGQPKYNYGYIINNPVTGDRKTQTEVRNGDNVSGSYSVVEPDGNVRTVTYTSDAVNGFNAKVSNSRTQPPAANTVP